MTDVALLGVESERVACPVCASQATRVLAEGPGWAMGRCPGCRLLRQNPRLTAQALRDGTYDRGTCGVPTPRRATGLDASGLAPWESKPQEAFRAGVDEVERRRPSGASRGLWIDVGCQTGGMLLAARERGYDVAGVDVDSRSAEFCRARHGADARAGTLTEGAFPAACADVVSYRQVLEHVHDLVAELAEVSRVLAPGGLLLVEVPHGRGVRILLDLALVALRLRHPRVLFRNVPQHLYYFDAANLERLLTTAGFEVLVCVSYGRYRLRRSLLRRAYEALRDRLRLGNKLRLVARRPRVAELQPTI